MGKLVGLLGAGISLAVEAASEYHSNKSAGKRSNTHLQQDLTYGTACLYLDNANTKSHLNSIS